MVPSEIHGCFLNLRSVLFCLAGIALLLPVALVEGEAAGGQSLHNLAAVERLADDNNEVHLDAGQSRLRRRVPRVKRHGHRRRYRRSSGSHEAGFPTTRYPTGFAQGSSPYQLYPRLHSTTLPPHLRTTTAVWWPGLRPSGTQPPAWWTTWVWRGTTRPWWFGGTTRRSGGTPFYGSSRGWNPVHTNPPKTSPPPQFYPTRDPNSIDVEVDPDASQQLGNRNRNIIIGSVAGGVVLLLILFICVFIVICGRRKKKNENDEEKNIDLAVIPQSGVYNNSLRQKTDETPGYLENPNYEEP